MRIVADENIPLLDEFFAGHGAIRRLPGRAISAADVADADVLLVRSVTRVDQALLQGSPVRFVGTCTIGTDHLALDYFAAADIAWASAPGCNARGVVDYVLGSLLLLGALLWLRRRFRTMRAERKAASGGEIERPTGKRFMVPMNVRAVPIWTDDGVTIDADALVPPPGDLLIEGAGGALVPVTRTLLYADLFARWQIPVIVCARTALGTINHSLMTIEVLESTSGLTLPGASVRFFGEPLSFGLAPGILGRHLLSLRAKVESAAAALRAAALPPTTPVLTSRCTRGASSVAPACLSGIRSTSASAGRSSAA